MLFSLTQIWNPIVTSTTKSQVSCNFVQPIFTIIIIIYGIKNSYVHKLTRETKYHLFEEKKEHVKNAARNSHPPESTVQNKRQWRTELQIHP